MSKTIVLDAGHGMKTAGKRCMSSIDPNQTREWWLNDRIADMVQESLRDYDCMVLRADDTTGVKDISLSARVKTANDKKADMYISIHHNAGVNGGTGGGTVVYYYSNSQKQAQRLYDSIVNKTGLRGNRSQKVIKNGFYVIKNTKMTAFLIENGFMDSRIDTPIILTAEHAQKTAQGIVEFLVAELHLNRNSAGKTVIFGVDYGIVFDATYYAGRYPDLKAAFGADAEALLNHFITFGMAEGRQGNAEFSVQAYKERYADLRSVFGDNLPEYYRHYSLFGKSEKRIAV